MIDINDIICPHCPATPAWRLNMYERYVSFDLKIGSFGREKHKSFHGNV